MKPLPMLKMPAMQCDKGCGACCTLVMCHEDEFQNIVEFIQARGIVPRKQGITCPLYQDGTCTVYEHRPWICQMMGHTKELECSRGYNRNIPTTVERKLAKKYMNVPPTRILHELLGEGWQSLLLQEVRKNP